MEKERLDKVLVKRKLAKNREQAKAFIMSGDVFVDGQKITKAGSLIKENAKIEVQVESIPYVSRGGLKLERAIEHFKIKVRDKICLDVGASTGGFTDCLLKNGASLVYAIDVGYGQLDWSLRQDKRVVNIERVNVRYLGKEDFFKIIKNKTESLPEVAAVDVSFISLEKILPKVYELTAPLAQIIILIKPQFEAGREKVEKGGVVKDKKVHEEVIERIRKFIATVGLKDAGLIASPITGPAGNIEYLMYLKKE